MLRYDLDPDARERPLPKAAGASAELLAALGAVTVGVDHEAQTPFGAHRVVYADYTASGRAAAPVEDFIRDSVLPGYGNTHTLSTATARQTTYLRSEAREVIR